MEVVSVEPLDEGIGNSLLTRLGCVEAEVLANRLMSATCAVTSCLNLCLPLCRRFSLLSCRRADVVNKKNMLHCILNTG